MIGGIILRQCLESDEVAKVTSIVRKPTGKTHSKLVEVVHPDFTDYSSIQDHFKNQDYAYLPSGLYLSRRKKERAKS